MCGIAGIFSFKGTVEESQLKAMTDAIIHRGPDGEGHWLNTQKTIGLGHRRLSIIDLSDQGKQPMHFGEGRYTIVFNGEIYNYIELRAMLEKEGYRFVSESDTEVLLAIYDHKKEKCLDDLDGMFAFAIWDARERQLFCARDRFGEKPFHYYHDQRQFVFASEIKQFWAYGIRKSANEQRLQSFLISGDINDHADPGATFYTSINKLDAAHYMIITLDGQVKTQRYWQINILNPTFKGGPEDAASEFLGLLTESVKIRLRSDVPVGSSLSGGLDSSSIVMLIDRLKENNSEQNIFSARFKDFEKDEGKHIEAVVASCRNVNAYSVWPDQDYFLHNLERVTYHQDEPYMSASIVAQYAVMELAAKNNVTVLLDGQGADEYLAGYQSQYATYLNQLFYHKKEQYGIEYQAYSALHESNPFLNQEDGETMRMKLGRIKRKVLKQDMPISNDALRKQLKYDTQVAGLKDLLRYADRNSMAHSREVRLPFLSHKLVEFAFTLPDNFKLRNGWSKYILRLTMQNILPNNICWRKDKIGYEPPQESWLEVPVIRNEIEKASNLFIPDFKQKNLQMTNALAWRLLIVNRYFGV